MKKIIQLFTGKSKDSDLQDTQVTPEAVITPSFTDLKLSEALCRAVADEGYTSPTPIQLAAIPIVLKKQDLLGCAQTGTGKTAAFALPILDLLLRAPEEKRGIKALILTPTRELAVQVADNFRVYARHTKLKSLVVYGGVSLEPQKASLRRHPDVLVATPGRLLDLYQQKYIDFRNLEIFVLDEADRMLDMGFLDEVRRIATYLPQNRQNLLFSATMPPDIENLAMSLLKNPERIEVARQSTANTQIEQKLFFVDRMNKRKLLVHLLDLENVPRALVFTRTKIQANRVSEFLYTSGFPSEAIHGDKSQNARQRALDNFRKGKTKVLVASDVAARGIDVDSITHVINYDLPNVPETYVHRIGRTGRAHSTGIAISFCDASESGYVSEIEKLLGKKIKVITDHPYHDGAAADQAESYNNASTRRTRNQAFHSGPNNYKPYSKPGGGRPQGGGNRSHQGRSNQGGPRKPRQQPTNAR